MTVVRSALFTAAFYLWLAAVGVAAAPLLLADRRGALAVLHLWARGVLALLRWIARVEYRVVGLDRLPPGPVLVAAQHQSTFETILLPLLVRNAAFVVKQELLRVPVFGWYAVKLGNIGIDRGRSAASIKPLLRAARAVVAAGRSLVIFPQGTRIPAGVSAPYRPGVGLLYRELQVAVVPVALDSGRCWPPGTWRKTPGVITIRFLPAIAPGLPRAQFMAELENRLAAAGDRFAETA